MNKKIKAIIMCTIIGILVACFCGFTRNTENSAEALTQDLALYGFDQDKNDPDYWVYKSEMSDLEDGEEAMVYCWFDTVENIGVMTATGNWTEDGEKLVYYTYVIEWNMEERVFEVISDFGF